MTNARSLRVYLGSSITELEDERKSISESISRDLTGLFEQDDIIIQFLKCESIHEGNDGTPDQDLNQGDYPQALEYYQKALAIREKGLGKEFSSTASTYNNIGAVYHNQGNYPQALEYLEKALIIFKARWDDDHPYTKTTQKWIDATQAAMGK